MAVTQNTFSFFMPLEIAKGEDGGAAPNGGERRIIEGIASTESEDLQGEIVRVQGIDTSYFLEHGYINDDHKPVHVGEPLEAKITKAGLYTKALMYGGCVHKSETPNCNDCRADYWWALANSLERAKSAGGRRKVGFSIEGAIQRRDGNIIEKCWLKNIAITANPINTDTFAAVAKSLSAQPWCESPGAAKESACACACGTCLTSREAAKKSLSDGMTVDQTVAWIVSQRRWAPVVAEVVAMAIHRKQTAR